MPLCTTAPLVGGALLRSSSSPCVWNFTRNYRVARYTFNVYLLLFLRVILWDQRSFRRTARQHAHAGLDQCF